MRSHGHFPFSLPWEGEGSRGPDTGAGGTEDLRYRWDVTARRLERTDPRRTAGMAALVTADALAVAAAVAVALWVAGEPEAGIARWVELLPITMAVALGWQALSGTYGTGPGGAWRRPWAAAVAAALSAATLALLAVAYPVFRLPAGGYLTLGAVLAALVTTVRAAGEWILRSCYRRGWFRRPALVVGTEDHAGRIDRWLEERGYHGLEVTEAVPPPEATGEDELLPFPELGRRIAERDHPLVLVPRTIPGETFRSAAYQCFLHGAELLVVTESSAPLPFRVLDQDEHGLSRIALAVPRLQPAQVLVKRTLDLALSGIGLTMSLPVLAAVAVAVKLDSAGPVFFRQERLGRGGRRFHLLKFRSMVVGAEERLREDPALYRRYVAGDYKLPAEEDPRVTRVGRVLRATSLDELPQLVNVLTGDMSLVGPRPVVPPEIEEYGIHAPVLLGVRPGLTGFWQISGWEEVAYPQRARWEIEYVENWSLWLDLKIMARTVPLVLRKIVER